MKLAIMQPYFLPYIGYFQLIKAADTFIFYDDVHYIKQGWINRNQILLNNEAHLFTLKVRGAGSFTKINNITLGNNRQKLLKTFQYAYHKSPYFNIIEPLLKYIYNQAESNLSAYIIKTTEVINDYLNLKTPLMISSEIEKNNTLKGQDKVMELCKILNADTYINAIGGLELYSKNTFEKAGINLEFLKSGDIQYQQFCSTFVPGLSIIDVLMFNSVEKISKLLNNYTIVHN